MLSIYLLQTKAMKSIINQLFEIEQKSLQDDYQKIARNIRRIYNELEEAGFTVINPYGESYKDTRTDLEATLSGKIRSDSKVVKVMKPIIYKKDENNQNFLIQKGVVIVD